MNRSSRLARAAVVVFAIFLLVIAAISSVMAERLTVTGKAPVIGGDEAKAREAALLEAFRKAVEKGVGTIIASDSLVENYQLISDQIYTKARGYVRDWRMLSEYAVGDTYVVEIDVEVSRESIEEDLIALNILQKAKHKPRIMVIIPETHIGRIIPDPAGETEIIKRLLEKDFKVIDQAQSKKIRESDRMKAVLQGDDAAAAQIGLQYGAEVVIVGEAFSESAGSIHGMESTRARVEARAIDCDTANILAADGREAGGADIAQFIAGKKALRNAAGELADYLIAQIVKNWGADIAGGAMVQVTINNVSFSQYSQFKKGLADVAGVKDIHPRSFLSGVAKLDVDFQGNAEMLADRVSSTDFGSIALEITGLTANRVEMRVQ